MKTKHKVTGVADKYKIKNREDANEAIAAIRVWIFSSGLGGEDEDRIKLELAAHLCDGQFG